MRVVAAVIQQSDRYLVTRRLPHDTFAGCWEFPGGKVEIGETDEEALIRELGEELGILISVDKLYMQIQHSYTDFDIDLNVYLASIDAGKVTSAEGQAFQWISVDDMESLEFVEADQPIAHRLIQESFK